MFKGIYTLTLALIIMTPSIALADKKLFRDDFNGKKGSAVNSKVWGTETHVQGRGQFNSRGWINGQGQISMSVRTYNAKKKGSFGQSLIKTKKSYGPSDTKNIRIRWRAKVNHNQKGIVHGAFLYRQYMENKKLKSDEIDFEWLTNHTAGTKKDDLLVSTWYKWDRAAQKYEQNATKYGTHLSREADYSSDTNAWRTYEILWSKESLIFKVGSTEVYRFSDSKNVPKGKMPIFINAWVADSSWQEAYNSSYKATKNAKANKTSAMLVDWVDVYEIDK